MAHDRLSVSVLMATFNSGRTLGRAIESISSQTGLSYELLIADGSSTDETCDILKKHAEILAFWISEPDRGVYDAWNKLLPRARGEWICFIGSDDQLASPDSLRLLHSAAKSATTERVVYGIVKYVKADGTPLYEFGTSWPKSAGGMVSHMSIPHVATLHHRSIFDDRGLFDPRFRIAGDYHKLRVETLQRGALFVPHIVAIADTGGLSTSPAMERRTHTEIGVILREANSGRAPLSWYLNSIRIFVRYVVFRVFGSRAESLLGALGRWRRKYFAFTD